VSVPDAEGEEMLAYVAIAVKFPSETLTNHHTHSKCQRVDIERLLPGEKETLDPSPIPMKCIQMSDPTILHSPMHHHPPLPPISSGCKWSLQDWSCAYDSIFMVLLYVYCQAENDWRTPWRGCNPLTTFLAKAFQEL
jgi:hypothetical protein